MRQYNIIGINSLSGVAESLCCHTTLQACMYRTCAQCKPKTIINKESNLDFSTTIFYYQWLRSAETRTIKGKEVVVKLTSKQRVRCTIEKLVETFESEIPKILPHSYRVWHQLNFSKTLKETMTPNEVILVIDFSENYNLKYSKEIQSVHFGASKGQLSLHTGAFYYKNTDKQISCKTFCSVSSCLRHDACAIWAHLQPVIKLIKKCVVGAKILHVVSDGPTTQYRNKSNFFLFTHFCNEAGFSNATWNFSESGHGKSIADGVGGVIKRTADKNVAQGHDVSCIDDFVQCLAGLKCEIFLINENSIITVDKILEGKKLSSLPNTMKLHQLFWKKSTKSQLHLRDLSCVECRNEADCPHYTLTPGIFQFLHTAVEASNSILFKNYFSYFRLLYYIYP